MIRLYKIKQGLILEKEGKISLLKEDWDACISHPDMYAHLNEKLERASMEVDPAWQKELLPPIGSQEVWAAGVTYLRSKEARMEESGQSGGASFYDKVYTAERPELFFKSMPQKVIGNGGLVRIRRDSTWNVPEPELTLVINAAGKIIGYTIGNDMSSRSIEGENPLYLPQAKIYDGSAAIGPCVLITEEPIPPATGITMTVERQGKIIFEGGTSIDRMKRTHEELVGFLYLENSFPQGCYLMTGTCVVPEGDFTLQKADKISITIEHIGTLVNTVA